MAGCDFIVNVAAPGGERRVTSVVAGDMEKAFLEGVRFMASVCKANARTSRHCGHQLGRVSAGHDVLPGGEGPYRVPADRQARGRHSCWPASLSEGMALFPIPFPRESVALEVFVDGSWAREYFVLDQWQLEELAKVAPEGTRVKIVGRFVARCPGFVFRRGRADCGASRGRFVSGIWPGCPNRRYPQRDPTCFRGSRIHASKGPVAAGPESPCTQTRRIGGEEIGNRGGVTESFACHRALGIISRRGPRLTFDSGSLAGSSGLTASSDFAIKHSRRCLSGIA